jgi:hypothetical protein
MRKSPLLSFASYSSARTEAILLRTSFAQISHLLLSMQPYLIPSSSFEDNAQPQTKVPATLAGITVFLLVVMVQCHRETPVKMCKFVAFRCLECRFYNTSDSFVLPGCLDSTSCLQYFWCVFFSQRSHVPEPIWLYRVRVPPQRPHNDAFASAHPGLSRMRFLPLARRRQRRPKQPSCSNKLSATTGLWPTLVSVTLLG